MKVKLMRERLHEAIELANDEKIIAAFRSIPLEISRSKHLSLLQIRELVKDAEEELNGSSSEEDMELLKNAHRTFFAVLRKKSGGSEAPAS